MTPGFAGHTLKIMLIPLRELPPEGALFTLADQSAWLAPIRAFGMKCAVSRPLVASVSVIPAESGCLARGRLAGTVVLPCNRCAEDASVSLTADFEEFEPLPEKARENGEESRIVLRDGVPLLDLDALCWEEFLLALPLAPLCRPDCKGICPACGTSLNNGPCACARDGLDPRLAALRGLKMR
ncbi:MAG: DUF177 domain-containing protein [Desulfovibrio sp.]|nr:DUF177 domain-containing protein [Desulfovibrio sp.]